MSLFSFLDSFFTDLGKSNKDPHVEEKAAFQQFINNDYSYYYENRQQRTIESFSSMDLELLLARAVAEHKLLVIKHLLRYGVNPLRAILQTESEVMLTFLQTNGASLKHELINPTRITGDKLNYIKKLIRFGASPNACIIEHKRHDGSETIITQLKYLPLAYSLDSIEAVQCLLEHGANPLEVDYREHSALDYALLRASVEVCEAMLTYARRSGQSIDVTASLFKLMKATKSVQSTEIAYLYEKTKYLLGIGADVNYQNQQGVSVVMAAIARKGVGMIVQLLVEHGADLELKDVKGRTAAVRALLKKDAVSFQMLERLGAKISTKARRYYEDLLEQEQVQSERSGSYDESSLSSSEIRELNGQQLASFTSIHKE